MWDVWRVFDFACKVCSVSDPEILSDLIIQCKQDVFLGRVLLDRGKIAKFYWERRKKANMKMKRCPVSMDIFHGTYH